MPPAIVDAGPPLKKPKGGMDVTFAVVSDTHIGYGEIDKEDEQLVAKVNTVVPQARGLVITGDLTEWGQEKEWTRFLEVFSGLKMPLYEMVGNHDKVAKGPWIEQQVSARHNPGSRFYSWDWDDLHLVALQEGPDDDGLAFLEKDLAPYDKSFPLVVFFHLAIRGPWSAGNWFDESYKERFYTLIKDRNVAAIFHGHHHATDHYQWHGLDVWKPGAVKNGAHTFAVVHATDANWEFTEYDWDGDRWGMPYKKGLKR